MSKYILPEPPIHPSTDLEAANQENYLAWKAQSDARKRCMTTLFSAFQGRSFARLCQHREWEEDTLQDIDALKNDITRRLSQGCGCEACRHEHEELRERLIAEKKRRDSGSASSQSSSDGVELTGRGSVNFAVGAGVRAKSPTRVPFITTVSGFSSPSSSSSSPPPQSPTTVITTPVPPPSAPDSTQVGTLPRSRHHRRSCSLS